MRSTSLLRGLSDAELDTLMTCFAPRVRRYAKGELLLMAGYETHELGLVLEGAITASKPLADGGTVVIANVMPDTPITVSPSIAAVLIASSSPPASALPSAICRPKRRRC